MIADDVHDCLYECVCIIVFFSIFFLADKPSLKFLCLIFNVWGLWRWRRFSVNRVLYIFFYYFALFFSFPLSPLHCAFCCSFFLNIDLFWVSVFISSVSLFSRHFFVNTDQRF
ncbi:hypothetical protein P167DRAFT_378055 [Morchella conica CCBAS932]|uniref:Uncharacterized protein n=1 Tax=Morchella conica CCBAS932 TaxID=1392247 RepID=A0A3N4L296_9PEZI|nr:hypothetical protein P167DRAFT_378055 [Morchella conica CCBAS932]